MHYSGPMRVKNMILGVEIAKLRVRENPDYFWCTHWYNVEETQRELLLKKFVH